MSAHAPTIESRDATRPGPDAVLFQVVECLNIARDRACLEATPVRDFVSPFVV